MGTSYWHRGIYILLDRNRVLLSTKVTGEVQDVARELIGRGWIHARTQRETTGMSGKNKRERLH